MGACLGKSHELSPPAKEASPDAHVVSALSPTLGAPDEAHTPKGLHALLTDPTSTDRQLNAAVLVLVEQTRVSDEQRGTVGTAPALQRLATLLMRATPPTCLATAEVLRNISLKRGTHQCVPCP